MIEAFSGKSLEELKKYRAERIKFLAELESEEAETDRQETIDNVKDFIRMIDEAIAKAEAETANGR